MSIYQGLEPDCVRHQEPGSKWPSSLSPTQGDDFILQLWYPKLKCLEACRWHKKGTGGAEALRREGAGSLWLQGKAWIGKMSEVKASGMAGSHRILSTGEGFCVHVHAHVCVYFALWYKEEVVAWSYQNLSLVAQNPGSLTQLILERSFIFEHRETQKILWSKTTELSRTKVTNSSPVRSLLRRCILLS